MPFERFVSCCTTLQLAAREVARVAFLQVSRERPTALLGLSAIWAALVVCIIRSLSINPLSIRPLHRWIYDVNAVLEMATIKLQPLTLHYNLVAAATLTSVSGATHRRGLQGDDMPKAAEVLPRLCTT